MSDTLELTANAHQRVLDVLTRELGDAVLDSVMEHGDLWVRVDNAAWHRAFEVCKRQLNMTWFCFLAGLDWAPLLSNSEKTFTGEEAGSDDDVDDEAGGVEAEDEPVDDAPAEMVTGVAGGATRFQVFARLHDASRSVGVTLKADLDDDDPRIASVTDLFRGADWHEREAWEFYGFQFDGHPGLRHLYLPLEFEGFPGRKDFPLLARELKPWPGLVNVEQIPEHLDPKKIAEKEAAAAAAAAPAETAEATETTEATETADAPVETAETTEAPGADAVPAEQAAEAVADTPEVPQGGVQQMAPEAAEEVAASPEPEAPKGTAPGTNEPHGDTEEGR